MAQTEYHDLIEDLSKLLEKVKKMKPKKRPLVVCLPGTLKGYFVKTYL